MNELVFTGVTLRLWTLGTALVAIGAVGLVYVIIFALVHRDKEG